MIVGLVVVVLGAVALMLGAASHQLMRDITARRAYFATLRALRWWMLPAAAGQIAGLVAVSVLLLSLIPFLQFGWWMLLGGSGNVALGQTGRSGEWWQLVGLLVPLWLTALLPHFAYQEEMVFRYGSEQLSRGRQLRRQMVFGLSHSLIAGVPIGAGIALIGSGLLYQCVYFRSLQRLRNRTDRVAVSEAPARLESPPRPAGPYDPAAWDAHHAACDQVAEQNRALRDRWMAETKAQSDARDAQLRNLREGAVVTAAALHTVSNALIVGLLVTWLVSTSGVL